VSSVLHSKYFPSRVANICIVLTLLLPIWPPSAQLNFFHLSQTTSVRRIGDPGSLIKVHVEVDRIGGMELHIENLLQGQPLNQLADGVINSMWQLGLPFIKPMINELVSTAFTDIFNESFRYFPLEKFLAT